MTTTTHGLSSPYRHYSTGAPECFESVIDLIAAIFDDPTGTGTRWMREGACAQVGGDLWFPDKGCPRIADDARSICAACPVLTECRKWAIPQADLVGLWGGMTSRERQAARGDAGPDIEFSEWAA